jgi:AbiV family abortive infection protein
MSSNRSGAVAVDRALLEEIRRGVEKTFHNAEALYNEARLLGKAGALSRALFLHQISLEECSKIEILGAWATGHLMGHTVDRAKLKRALASHASKNRNNAYFLPVSAEEESAKKSGDVDGAAEAFKRLQDEFHIKANTAKNASLYVDYRENGFVGPNEQVEAADVDNIRALNEQFLALSDPSVRRLEYLTRNPEGYSQEFVNFEKRAEELKSQFPKDPQGAMEILLDELLGGKLRDILTESISDRAEETHQSSTSPD